MYQNIEILTETGKAKANGIEIYFERFGIENDPAIVLIMGLDAQCVLWSLSFIEPLVKAGYQVIRFDNRDIGLSSWIENWDKTKPYTLEDMAKDTIGLLDYLNIQQAHVIGASMGGMIAQRLAISHSERLLSLTCIMSSGHSMDPQAFDSFYQKTLVKIVPKVLNIIPFNNKFTDKYTNHRVSVSGYLATYKYLAGKKYAFDKDYFNALFAFCIEERKGQNPKARLQQLFAIIASGSRLKELKSVELPTLILHGTADRLLPIKHAKKYAALIKNSILVKLEGIGHEIPKAIIPEVHSHLIPHLHQSLQKHAKE
jgi:pimeloyl-ACP methyl ester carboxylesterase